MNMYAMQNDLPRLPLPSLEDTCNKLLEWGSPFLSDEEYAFSKKMVYSFKSQAGEGPFLQSRLQDLRNQKETQNWLEPFWYDTYLANRLPLPINSNVTFVLDKNSDVQNLPQSELAASLIMSLFEYHKILMDETLDVDYQGSAPLCMSQYKTLLGTSRIPGIVRDSLTTEESPKHVAIIANGHYFALNPFDGNNKMVHYSDIVSGIEQAISLSIENGNNPAGNLTTLDRPSWAEYRKMLIEIDSSNFDSLHAMDSALAVIILDQNEYSSEADMFKNMLCGDPNNRWYDKSLQFIAGKGKTFAVNYEHSGVDGTTLGNLARYLHKNMKAHPAGKTDNATDVLTKIIFATDFRIDNEIANANRKNLEAYNDLSIEVLVFEDFGKNYIKALKTSPDSFIQIAMQLAQHKTFGKVNNTYEAVMTKQFLHGRTEAMRPVTKESLTFIETRSKTDLIVAAKKHIERIIECKNGYGIDRHLFGLAKMHEECFPGEDLPEIFNSPSYKNITLNYFSTSTSNSFGLMHAGYGPVTNDGYALRYLIYEDELHFLLSSMSHNADTLVKLKDNLKKSLVEMSLILEK